MCFIGVGLKCYEIYYLLVVYVLQSQCNHPRFIHQKVGLDAPIHTPNTHVKLHGAATNIIVTFN